MACRILGYSAFCCSCCPWKLLRRGLYFLHVGRRLKVSGAQQKAPETFFSHVAVVWGVFLRKTFFSVQTNIAMEQKQAEFRNYHAWKIGFAERCLLGCAPGTVCAGTVLWLLWMSSPLCKPRKLQEALGINRCCVELPLKIPVKEWMCWTTSTKISL